MHIPTFRNLVLNLLDDEHGINGVAWELLKDKLLNVGSDDIVHHVETYNGRYFLPENHPLKP